MWSLCVHDAVSAQTPSLFCGTSPAPFPPGRKRKTPSTPTTTTKQWSHASLSGTFFLVFAASWQSHTSTKIWISFSFASANPWSFVQYICPSFCTTTIGLSWCQTQKNSNLTWGYWSGKEEVGISRHKQKSSKQRAEGEQPSKCPVSKCPQY